MEDRSLLLYKYRSTNKIEYIEDILKNKRLYAALLEDLNDPMDGFLRFDIRKLFPDAHDLVCEVQEISKNWRIVSLSQSCENHLLWSYYADGFRGVAIGIKPTTMARKINYVDEVILFDEFANLRNKDWQKVFYFVNLVFGSMNRSGGLLYQVHRNT